MDNFEQILVEAENAAAKAAEKWLREAEARGPKYSVHSSDLAGNSGPAVGYLLDVCGFAWIEFKDRRSGFYRWCKKYVNAMNNSRGMRPERTLYRVPIGGAYDAWRGRQEMGLKEAAMYAANEVFLKYGIKTYVRSRID